MGSILKYGCGGALMLLVIGIGAVMLVVGLTYRPDGRTGQAVPTIQTAPPIPVRPDPTLATYEGVTESRLREELDKLSKGGSMADPVPFATLIPIGPKVPLFAISFRYFLRSSTLIFSSAGIVPSGNIFI